LKIELRNFCLNGYDSGGVLMSDKSRGSHQRKLQRTRDRVLPLTQRIDTRAKLTKFFLSTLLKNAVSSSMINKPKIFEDERL